MQLNVKEIQRVMDWLDFKEARDGEPAHWQGSWAFDINENECDGAPVRMRLAREGLLTEDFCGTACCVAGYVALPYIDTNGPGFDPADMIYSVSLPFEAADGHVIDPMVDANYQTVSMAARAILGITSEEGAELFSANNSVEDIREIFNVLLEDHDESVRV